MTEVVGVDPALVDMMNAVFEDYHRRDKSSQVVVDRELWDRLDDLGLVRLTQAEDLGGSGGGWSEAAELLSTAVRWGVRTPLAEHDLLAGWLRDEAGLEQQGAIATVAVLDESGRAIGVPWASAVDRVVCIWNHGSGYRIADVAADTLQIESGANLLGEPRDAVVVNVNAVSGVPLAPELVVKLQLKSAMVRSIQTCAALDRVLDLAVEHARTRTQFGRPLAAFQAVQSMLADIAGECALARAATEAALKVAAQDDWAASDLAFHVAVARSCAGHATSVVVRNAHQIHGAIGTTLEHSLHTFTHAALAWRSEFGSVHSWDQEVSRAALSAGPNGLWRLIAG